MAIMQDDDGSIAVRKLLDEISQVRIRRLGLCRDEAWQESLKSLPATMTLEALSDRDPRQPGPQTTGISELAKSGATNEVCVVHHVLSVVTYQGSANGFETVTLHLEQSVVGIRNGPNRFDLGLVHRHGVSRVHTYRCFDATVCCTRNSLPHRSRGSVQMASGMLGGVANEVPVGSQTRARGAHLLDDTSQLARPGRYLKVWNLGDPSRRPATAPDNAEISLRSSAERLRCPGRFPPSAPARLLVRQRTSGETPTATGFDGSRPSLSTPVPRAKPRGRLSSVIQTGAKQRDLA